MKRWIEVDRRKNQGATQMFMKTRELLKEQLRSG
jgi:hypothetical protein